MVRSASPARIRFHAVLLIGFAAACALPAAAQPAPECPPGFAAVDVTVDPESEPLKVEPPSVVIHLGDAKGKAVLVCWRVHGLAEGETLHIEGKEGEPDLFPNLQRTIKAPRTTASSGHASAAGTWKYSLWITREGSGEKLHFTDPEVIVRGDGD